ncbi:MAG: triose-phosphate isomerase [Hirschia sp.]|nr:triose-phosphate isomerase [Hirschia sp.]MBF18011.1 triose-phosphate isomerase [Hirschia sp.]
MTSARKLIAGNWKMNGLRADLAEISTLAESLEAEAFDGDVAVCPPATLAALAVDLVAGKPVKIGGQDCHAEAAGAFTGDISAEKWTDLGAEYVIVGHSERREYYREDNAIVKAKAAAAIRAGLTPIICIGESLAEREAGKTLDVLGEQIAGCIPSEAKNTAIVVAYEPLWAIGTGHTPTLEQIGEAHAFMRKALTNEIGAMAATTPLLYGGSVKPANAKDILATNDVDGALVGGASLKASDFLQIIRAA